MILATALQAGDYLGIAALLAAFVGLPATLLLKQMRVMRIDFERRFELVEGRFKHVEGRINKVEEKKVGMANWLRDTVTTQRKLDRLTEAVSNMEGRIEAQLGMTAAINRLADKAVKVMEAKQHE